MEKHSAASVSTTCTADHATARITSSVLRSGLYLECKIVDYECEVMVDLGAQVSMVHGQVPYGEILLEVRVAHCNHTTSWLK
jgi:hypothetical protein